MHSHPFQSTFHVVSWMAGSSTLPPQARTRSSASIACVTPQKIVQTSEIQNGRTRYDFLLRRACLIAVTSFCHLVLKTITQRITVCKIVPISIPTQIPCTYVNVTPNQHIPPEENQTASQILANPSRFQFPYCRVKLQLEAENSSKRQANEIVAADVHEGDQGLPPSSNRHS